MPGPVSDSYDAEFGTRANAHAVQNGLDEVVAMITRMLGPALRNIVEVADAENGPKLALRLSARQWRLVRFGLLRAKGSV